MNRAVLLATVLAASLALPVRAAAPAPTPAPAPAPASISGQVLETTQAAGYTYLRLKTASGEIWAAVAAADVAKGAQVTIARPMTMEKFESRTLNKTFDKIVFGQLVDPKAPPQTAAQGAPGGMPATSMAMPGAGSAVAAHSAKPGAAAAVPVAKVAKAEGPQGRTVAEVVGGKATLKDKTVVVRARVVKVNNGIMGKNWVHLQDGSGSAADGSHDLVVTTQDQTAVGDVVQARGTVRTDVTVGAGYNYPVMIDGATLSK
jgi:hypothetical protein